MASRTSSRRKRRTASRSPNDATTLLKADHRKELQLRRASGATRRTSPSADAASATA